MKYATFVLISILVCLVILTCNGMASAHGESIHHNNLHHHHRHTHQNNSACFAKPKIVGGHSNGQIMTRWANVPGVSIVVSSER